MRDTSGRKVRSRLFSKQKMTNYLINVFKADKNYFEAEFEYQQITNLDSHKKKINKNNNV